MKLMTLLSTTYAGLVAYSPDSKNDISTLMGTTSTTTSTLGLSNYNIPIIADATNYMDSLSEEQLVELEEKLNLKDMEISMKDDTPKVKIYTKNDSSNKSV